MTASYNDSILVIFRACDLKNWIEPPAELPANDPLIVSIIEDTKVWIIYSWTKCFSSLIESLKDTHGGNQGKKYDACAVEVDERRGARSSSIKYVHVFDEED